MIVTFSKIVRNIKTAGLTVLVAAALVSSPANAGKFEAQATFEIGMRLLTSIVLTQTNPLSFESTTSGSNIDVTTSPDAENAVTLTASGEPNALVRATMVESEVVMTTGGGTVESEKITVKNFKYGGDLDNTGLAQFGSDGKLENLRVGATAFVQDHNIPGLYQSEATLRITYN